MSQPITLVSWNVFQGLHHTSKRNAWVQNDEIEGHIESLDADVLVLPEAWRHGRPDATWAEDLADRLGYQLHQWIADTPSRSREQVRWRIVMLTRIEARPLPTHVMARYGRFGRRAIVRAELVESGLTVAAAHLYGIHLVMQRQARNWMKERAELRAVSQSNDIVAGDLNMWAPVVRRDTSPLVSAVTGRTYPSRRPHSQIDHVLVSERIDVLDRQVLPDMGSDHRAIRATLQPR